MQETTIISFKKEVVKCGITVDPHLQKFNGIMLQYYWIDAMNGNNNESAIGTTMFDKQRGR